MKSYRRIRADDEEDLKFDKDSRKIDDYEKAEAAAKVKIVLNG